MLHSTALRILFQVRLLAIPVLFLSAYQPLIVTVFIQMSDRVHHSVTCGMQH